METKLKTRGLRVVAVSEIDPAEFDEEKAVIQATATEHGIHYPCFLDNGAHWMESSGIDDIPAFMVIDKQGNVAHMQRGKMKVGSEAHKKLAAAIEAALASS